MKDNRQQKKKNLKTEVVYQRKQKIGLMVLAKYTEVTNDINVEEVLVQKFGEKNNH